MRHTLGVVVALSLVAMFAGGAWAHSGAEGDVPKLLFKPTIDGDISEWEEFAFTDGVWDIDRITGQPWFSTATGLLDAVNDQTNESNEPDGSALGPDDLTTQYWLAWDDEGMWGGVRAQDNVHDVGASNLLPSRWPWRDACSWFVDVMHEGFAEPNVIGHHIWSFVAEYPQREGTHWWRHGEADVENLEVAAPPNVASMARVGGGNFDADYEIEMFMPWDNMIALSPNFNPSEGWVIGIVVVSTDPDGTTPDGGDIQDWGGQYVLWGSGAENGDFTLSAPIEGQPVAVETSSWSQIKRLFQ